MSLEDVQLEQSEFVVVRAFVNKKGAVDEVNHLMFMQWFSFHISDCVDTPSSTRHLYCLLACVPGGCSSYKMVSLLVCW